MILKRVRFIPFVLWTEFVKEWDDSLISGADDSGINLRSNDTELATVTTVAVDAPRDVTMPAAVLQTPATDAAGAVITTAIVENNLDLTNGISTDYASDYSDFTTDYASDYTDYTTDYASYYSDLTTDYVVDYTDYRVDVTINAETVETRYEYSVAGGLVLAQLRDGESLPLRVVFEVSLPADERTVSRSTS